MEPHTFSPRLLVIRRAAGAARWAATLVLGGPHSPAALFASLLALTLACKSRRWTRRAYALEAALEVVLALCACSAVHQLYPSLPGASALRATAALAAGNGVVALALSAKTSPLPFRWLAPTVAAMAAVLLAHTRQLCANSLLQHGWASLRTAGRILLPLVAPAFMDIMPRDGVWALGAPGPLPSPEAAAQCAPYQASSVLLAAAALTWHLWRAEQLRRKSAAAAAAAGRA